MENNMITLIRCLNCDEILEASVEGDVDVCSCDNKTTLIYDMSVIKISGEDFSKIAVFRESSQTFQECGV
jgi:hypothetical protein